MRQRPAETPPLPLKSAHAAHPHRAGGNAIDAFAYLILAGLVLYLVVLPFLVGMRRKNAERLGTGSSEIRRSDRIHDDRILFHCAVQGEPHYQENIRRVAIAGKAVVLALNPTNFYDRTAVRVDVDGLTIGYIPRDQAREASRDGWKVIIAVVNSGPKTTGVVLGVVERSGRKG